MLKAIYARPVPTLVPPESSHKLRPEASRRHVLNRMMQEKSGRLYCNEEFEIEIPSLDIYEAR
jgi:hypothetical protein